MSRCQQRDLQHSDDGAPSIRAELADDYRIGVGRKREARLMREARLKGLALEKFVTTMVTDPVADRARDKVQRHFQTAAPDRFWVA